MLHVVKRSLARAHQPLTSAPNAEYADLKQRLHSIKSSLAYTSSMLAAANRRWIVQMQEQRRFSDRFRESYPTTGDDVALVAAQFAHGSQRLYDQFTRETHADVTAYQEIHAQVLVYVREIETVEAMYGRLADAKSEAGRYQSKLDAMERSKRGPDEAKKTRNLQKMDAQKEAYKSLLRDVIAAQKRAYEKHPVVFKAALTAYWLSHERHVTLLVQSLEETQEFAKGAEEEMRRLDVAAWTPEAAEIGKCRALDAAGSSIDGYSEQREEDGKGDGLKEEKENREGKDEEEEEEEEFLSASTVPIDVSGAEKAPPAPSPTGVAEGFTASVFVSNVRPPKKAVKRGSEHHSGMAA